MKILNSVLSVAICITALMPTAQASAEYDRHYAVGKDFLGREQYKLAVDEFTQALKASSSATAFIDRGTAYSELKKYDAAISDLNQAIKIDGKNALAYTVRGVVYFRSFKPQQAIADFDRALALNHDDKYAVVNRAGAYLMLDNPALQAKNTQNWLERTQWKSDFAGHAATLTVLAYKLSKQSVQATSLSEISLKKLNHLFWPYSVLKFFVGKESQEKLLEHAEDSTYDLAQCQAFLGLDAYSRGDTAAARDKLTFVSKHGVVNSVEYWLAKFYIEKIDAVKTVKK
ncbi:MAG: tetratricopeptide repeat protein [Candidatus Obscuribacterales bacterium]|jgi:lipoprotein NlpI